MHCSVFSECINYRLEPVHSRCLPVLKKKKKKEKKKTDQDEPVRMYR